MRFLSFLLCALSVLLFTSPAARAEDSPPPPAGNVVTQTDPAAPTNPTNPAADSGTKTNARKEEDDETAGMLSRIKAYATGKTTLANNIAALEKKVATLTAQVKERDDRIATLTSENEKMRGDLAAFADWLEANGHTTAKEAASDPAAAFQKAVGNGVATEVRKIGVPAATVKTPAASKGEGGTDSLREAFRAETDPVKKSALFRQIKQADEAARSRSN